MGLSDIAAGIRVTTEQCDRGVATVDDTDATLVERLDPYAGDLPCAPAAAAAVLERYAVGGSVGEAAAAGEVPRVTAAKTLHLLGESVSPVSPTGRAVVRDWIAGDLSRTEAQTLARASPSAFALAAYVETHDPIDGARDAVAGTLRASDPIPAASSLADATEPPETLR